MILLNAIKIIFLLGFLVFIHEGGHFLVAKAFKINVKEFSIGFGPSIFTKQGKQTKYSVRAIPFGGYVDMLGEAERVDEEGSFSKAKVLPRIAIVAAGGIVNIVFGMIVFFILTLSTGTNVSTTIGEILPEYANNLTNLKVGDTILEIEGNKVHLKSDIDKNMQKIKSDEPITLLVERDGKNQYISVNPSKYDEKNYILGIKVSLKEKNLENNLYYAFWETINFTLSIGDSLKMLFTGAVSPEQMMGPIGISEMVVETSSLYNFIYLLSLVSLSLGVTNLLPIPALDGGKILILIIEGIRGKALKEEVELGIQSAGFTLLILFSLYVSYNDILRIF